MQGTYFIYVARKQVLVVKIEIILNYKKYNFFPLFIKINITYNAKGVSLYLQDNDNLF